MTDRTIAVTPGSGDSVDFDDNKQLVKFVWGATGVHTKIEDSAGKRLPVSLGDLGAITNIPVSQFGAWSVTISDGSGPVTVDGTVTISDGGGSITVDGSIAADTELPAAAAIAATGNSVPSTVITVSALGTYNGTTLDLVQTGAADAATSAQKVPNVQFAFNGSNFDRVRTITATMDQVATGILAAGIVGQFDDVSTGTVTENQFSTVRITSARALHTSLQQIAGVAVAAGNGVSGTGVLRVTMASDSTGILAGVTTVTTLTNITNWGNIVDNAAFTDGTTRLMPAGFIFDETAGTALTENDAGAARINANRAQVVVLEDGTTRGTRQGVTSDGAAKAVQKFLQVTATTLTRPANTTAYSANDAVSNNATASSVTAQTFAMSAIADHPISIDRIRVASTDTGVAGKAFRLWLYNSDPAASSGIAGGDNAAWSQKLAGFIGTMSGVFRSFSDGCAGLFTPDEGARIVAKPGSGVTTIWITFQTLEAFTPSANSTTFIATAEGFQGHS